ncbi:hypothetical protein XENTR_v10018728 [Xenopus tropicalis]|uniref:E3 ubiquitin-protein ligase RNF26 n=1 Tax=Xenopus tropicalis TaxID=8364 RepID=Q0VFN3_XENTR|nr:E3 ubiquitin-protein ligase RNF26 [Xenopus tropicalis]AAI18766.1 hypothetical protein MGC145700 [Xenopus tropicalis]KAE8592320.1 hypothetical protein XENTR_v10018728 [Xenopus tropicalis]KAE8592321.1 hypothetical protein XENTR_v10018728 [Xenopus tropicalis]|eukprot:NP_001072206.1 RING finger protein 26 [Xenopus tropicalis]
MQGIILFLNGLGWTLDMLFLLLDLNYMLVSSVVSVLCWTICFIFNLPWTLTNGILQLWEAVLGFVLMVGDSSCSLALGTVQTLVDALWGCLAGLDSLKLIWNLLCHLLFRSRELIHRGLLNITFSVQTFHRNFWEALSITGGLAAYLVNSLVNICLIAIQNILSAAVALWLSMVNVILMGAELMFMLLSQFSNSAVAVAILLWTPCQLILDGFASLSRGVGIIFYQHLYKILIFLLLAIICRIIFRPSPAVRQFQLKVIQIYRMALVLAWSLLHCEVLRRVIAKSAQIIRMFRIYGATLVRGWNLRRTRIQNPPARPATVQNPARIRERNQVPMREQNPPLRPIQSTVPNRVQNTQPATHIPQASSAFTKRGEPSQDPWKLLKQQEESKKCVICQDENKTVLLLPCRHLCLCASCTEILLQQPVHQRNCPLCRQMILQTLNVYI